MKQFSKKISKFLLLGSIFVTLSCEVQEKYNESNTSQKIIVEDFSLQSIQGKTNSKLLEVANKVKSLKTKAENSKIVYNADFDFYMDDEHGKHVVIDGKESYIFEITRTTGDQKVENIVFNKKTDGSFDTFIIKYDFTKNEFNSLPISILKDKATSYSELDTQTNRFNVICVVTETWVPGDNYYMGELNGGGGRTLGYWATSGMDCSGGSSTNTPAYSGGNPNGGMGNPAGGPRPTGGIPSTPVVNSAPTPCQQLCNLTNDNATFNARITNLETKVTGTQEFGFISEMTYNAGLGELEINNYNLPNNTGSEFSSNIKVGGFGMGSGHNHPVTGQSIPSWGDLHWIADCYNNATIRNKDYVFSVVVVGNSQDPTATPIDYVITIANITALNLQIANDLAIPRIAAISNIKEQIEAMNDKEALLFASVQTNTVGMEEVFLKTFANFGINLFKKDKINNNWNKLKLTNPIDPLNPSAPNPVVQEPCN